MVERLIAAQAKTGCKAENRGSSAVSNALWRLQIRASDNGSEVPRLKQNPGGLSVCATGISYSKNVLAACEKL